jgi:transcriptional regulator with XRE-family HTH domain
MRLLWRADSMPIAAYRARGRDRATFAQRAANRQRIRCEPAGNASVVSLAMTFDDDTRTDVAADPTDDALQAPDDAPDPTTDAAEYAAIGMDSSGAEWTNTGDVFDTAAQDRWLRLGILPSSADPTDSAPMVEELVGRAVLRCRLYWGWSQKELERRSGVDQTTISRLERGLQKGLSVRRLFAILKALRVADVLFEPRKSSVAPTALDLMIHGDPWERALRRADARLNRRRSA